MNSLRKLMGPVWMLLSPLSLGFLFFEAVKKISEKPTQDVYLPWVIILTIYTPIAVGLAIFGWYAWKEEYRLDDEEIN